MHAKFHGRCLRNTKFPRAAAAAENEKMDGLTKKIGVL